MHKIRKDDMVKVIAGKDKDKTGPSCGYKEKYGYGRGLQYGNKAYEAQPGKSGWWHCPSGKPARYFQCYAVR